MKFKTLYLLSFLPILGLSMWFIWSINYIHIFDRIIGSILLLIIIFVPYFLLEKGIHQEIREADI